MKRFPWQGSFRSIPPAIRTALNTIGTDLIIVTAVKKIPVRALQDGQYAHLGVSYDGSAAKVGDPVLLDADVGRYAARNREGWEVKRTDLPMVTKSYSWETPNFGDAATYGYHTHYQDRDVYQVEVFEPRMFTISAEVLNAPGADAALVRFTVDQVLEKNAGSFEADFLFCLNLLQESTGVVGVYASNATRDDFIRTVTLDWEIFPPGHRAELIAAIKRERNGLSADKAGLVASRIQLFDRLPVQQFIKGSGPFGSYVGALYSDDLVVFENMNYGNAMYVLYDDWKDVSQRSRLELLRGTTSRFDRIVHTDGWEDRFENLINSELEKRDMSSRKRHRRRTR
jgi:hypothetical protein